MKITVKSGDIEITHEEYESRSPASTRYDEGLGRIIKLVSAITDNVVKIIESKKHNN